ncbi:Lrp/AsnC family transcriptional regulator [Sphingopyxis granuli]|uniref:Lrp/AsnC family transcriptional regulator n=1 Tax=Sphingopyxis granuli TaxID=267128 RepID=UPI0030B8C927
MVEMDETDRRLLRKLQADASLSLEQLGAAVQLSTNSVWRRVKRLEAEGVITRRIALLDPQAVGLGLTVFVAIKTADHSVAWLSRFREAASAHPEIVEIYRMAGDTDYLLKLHVAGMEDYDRVYKKLIAKVALSDVSASFAMETLKNERALPV